VYVKRYGADDTKWFLRQKQNILEAKLVVVATEAGAPPDDWRPE
jgi:hypothetical protein